MGLWIDRHPNPVRTTADFAASGFPLLLIKIAALWWLATEAVPARVRIGPSAAVHRRLRHSIWPILLAATVTTGPTIGCTSEPDIGSTQADAPTRAPADTPLSTTGRSLAPTPVVTGITPTAAPLAPATTPTHTTKPDCGRLCHEEFWGSASVVDLQAELDAGADIAGRSKEHQNATPLHLAVSNGADAEMVALLLDRGAKLSARYNQGMTVLHAAVANSADPEVVELLLDHGANVNAKDVKLRTPLALAVAKDASVNTVRILLHNGSDVLHEDLFVSPLIAAARHHSDPTVLELLFSRLPDKQTGSRDRDFYLTHALSNAEESNPHPAVTEWLRDQGANSGSLDDPDSPSPLAMAVANNPNSAVIESILDRGSPVELARVDGAGLTPLHWAIGLERLDVVKMFMDRGADVEAKTSYGATPLFFAADVASGTAGLGSGYSAPPGHVPGSLFPAIMTLLVEYGADLDATDNDGNTPLHRVVILAAGVPEYIPVAEAMLARGASKDAKNHGGKTACQFALQDGLESTVVPDLVCPPAGTKSP